MEKFIAFIVLLLLVNQRQKFVEGLLTPIQSVGEPIVYAPPPDWHQCFNDCTMQQEDCNSGCWCEPIYTGSLVGVCFWDGETPPSSCSSDHDCAQEHVSSNCFRPNHSESGLCLPKDINL
ncbi:hypothetical protein Leryth_002397 [Lithospermum erythrorhizon]|nr:hypothetical protein Leryth_002397 [Lithospermum erythrorhizon]